MSAEAQLHSSRHRIALRISLPAARNKQQSLRVCILSSLPLNHKQAALSARQGRTLTHQVRPWLKIGSQAVFMVPDTALGCPANEPQTGTCALAKINAGWPVLGRSDRKPSMKFEIQRVIYFTTNMEAMSRFYSEVMGLEPLPASEAGWKEFRAGGCNISLHSGKASAAGRGLRSFSTRQM